MSVTVEGFKVWYLNTSSYLGGFENHGSREVKADHTFHKFDTWLTCRDKRALALTPIHSVLTHFGKMTLWVDVATTFPHFCALVAIMMLADVLLPDYVLVVQFCFVFLM